MLRGELRAVVALAGLIAAAALPAAPAGATQIPDSAVDKTADSSAEITFPMTQPQGVYTPSSLAVGRTGNDPASVAWTGKFTFHPLRFDNLAIPGNSADGPYSKPLRSGEYTYYCGVHGHAMSGVVYVAGPKAKIEAKPEDAAPGGQILLDASTTDVYHRGAALPNVTYEFDPEGDGTFLPPSSSPTMTATYPTAGTFAPRVRVKDEAGRSDDANDFVYIAAADPPAQPPGPQPPVTGGDQPAQSKPPASTPTGAIPFSRVATLPDRRKCISRKRGLRIVVRDAPGENLRRVRVRVDGRLVKDVAVKGRRALTLRGLRGRPSVTVSLKLLDGRTRSKTFRYRVCGK